jgi:hypothetical protein
LKYISDKLIEELSFDGTINLKLCDQHKLRKRIRAHFIYVHEKAVDDTLIAVNRKNFKRPNFDDIL